MANPSIKMHAERVMKRLAGPSERMRDEKVAQQDVEAVIISEINRAAKLGLFESMRLDYKDVGTCYITTFKDVEVEQDNDLSLTFAKLPASFIQLPYGKGIDYIGPMRSREKEFIPVDPHNGFRTQYSPAAQVQGMVGYWVESDRLYFNRDIVSVDEIETLLVRLVIVDAEVIDRNAPLPMDPATMSDILDRVYQHFLLPEQSPKDITNNSVSDKK